MSAFTAFVDTLKPWRKSSYSGPDDGNECVEIATTPTFTAVRDTKAPAGGTLTFPAEAFDAFLDGLLDRH
ncbi:hypothetical protein AQJ58_13170 [Streptomyces sp. DSM 15324]|nr:hypothetical protein AQJ58_13170 [Streptomyces sp. DSM 15324]